MGIKTDWDMAGAGDQRPPAAESKHDAQMRVLHSYMQRTMQQTEELIRRAEHRDIELGDLRSRLDKNTEITEEVRSLLITIKGIGRLAKWGGSLAAAGTAAYTAIYMATHGGRLPGN